nr:10344_t:CDS:2 [Entrophospora candida]
MPYHQHSLPDYYKNYNDYSPSDPYYNNSLDDDYSSSSNYYSPPPEPTSKTYSSSDYYSPPSWRTPRSYSSSPYLSSDNYSSLTYRPSQKPTSNQHSPSDLYPRQTPYSAPKPTSKTYSSSDNYSPLTYPPSPKLTSKTHSKSQYHSPPPPRRTPDRYPPPPKPTSETHSSSWVDTTRYLGPKSSSDYYSPLPRRTPTPYSDRYPPSPKPTSSQYPPLDLYPPPRQTPYSDYYSPPSPKPTSSQYPPLDLYPPPRQTPYSDYYSPPSPKPTSETYYSSSDFYPPDPDYYSPPTYPPSPIPTSKTYSDHYLSAPKRQLVTYEPECLRCDAKPVSAEEDFCSKKCKNWVKQNAPRLLKLSETSEKYNKVAMQFLLGWKHPDKKSPKISSIHAICCSGFMVNRYNTYRDKVERKHQLEGQVSPEDNIKMSAGNERLRFHGTGTNGFKRFGNGIYFSATSSKSDDYNFGSQKSFNGAKYKTMLLNKVVVGNGHQLIFNNDKLNKPPHGYNSVLGEPNLMGNLNYDEVVVYKEKACIPQYLIVYEVD